MLRNKLFLIIVSILSVTLMITGYIYFKNMNEILNIQKQKELNSDKEVLFSYIDNTKNNLINLTKEISLNEELKSSVNLISLYEDPNNYIKETFDFEKNNLIDLSKKWIKNSSYYAVTIFNKDMKFIMINRNLKNNKALGYVTYNKNQKEFLDYNTKKTIQLPFIDEVNKKGINKFKLNFLDNSFLISYFKEIKLDKELIGYIKVTTSIDVVTLKNINNRLSLQIILKDQNNNMVFSSKKLENNYNSLKESNDIEFIKAELLKVSNNILYSISIVDSSIINEKLKNMAISILEVWIFLLLIIFTISVFFINKTILKPIDNLKKVIENIKTGKISKKIILNSKDEISLIVNEFNNLSIDLSKSIAFLESHKLAMDKSSIVTKSDINGNIIYINENFTKTTGYSKKEALHKKHNIVRHPDNPKEIFQELWNTIKQKKVWKKILKNRDKFGNDYWVDTTILPILDEQKNIVEYIAVRYDITKQIEQQNKLNKIANSDILTGLGNRYKLNEDIKNSTNPALAILNIDNFSQINDFYGHQIGDYVIKEFSLILEKNRTNEDYLIYHLQGDEYVVFHSNIVQNDFIFEIEKILKKLLSVTINIKEEKNSFNFSTAISFEDKSNILTTADMALKVAKRDNKSLIIYSDSISLNQEYQNNIKWAKKIKEGLAEDKFIPVFQPIVNNHTGIWEKYECLVRLKDNNKLISPYFFLDISKKTKHYTDITKVMLNKSFEMFKDKDIEFSVNLTIEDILNNDIQSYIFKMLEKYNIGERVVFEIVESESIENFEDIRIFIEKIKSFNCKIAIDDFGTGYSNFEYLLKLKADYIKIDGSMIKDIDKNKDAQLVVSTIVDFANKMNMKTIAEFVENESILNKVKELRIDYTQGYYYSEPKEEIMDDRRT